jgi:hypothetical protein
MTSRTMLRPIAIGFVAALLSAGIVASPIYAQTTTDKPAPRSQHAKKQKNGDKKPAAQQTETKSSGMSGYRPDPVTGY